MNGAVARIVLRYLVGGIAGIFAGILVTLQLIDPGAAEDFVSRVSTDRDLELVIAFLLPLISSAAIELWYWAAKKFGWAT